MSRILAIAIGLALPLPAHAQQQSPMEQAPSAKLGAEIGGSLQCSAALIVDQQALAQAQARVKALEEKYEPKPGSAPQQ
jgi:hypothetical protein